MTFVNSFHAEQCCVSFATKTRSRTKVEYRHVPQVILALLERLVYTSWDEDAKGNAQGISYMVLLRRQHNQHLKCMSKDQ